MVLASIFNPMPAGGIIYEARIAAVGAGGSGISDPSNSFSFPVTCTYAVTPSNRSVGVAGGSVSFSAAAPPGCAWSSSTSDGWIGMAGSGAGIGSGSVTFVVGNNPSSASRGGSVTIAGHSVSVNQSGIACSFTVSPTSRTVERTGGVVSISVEAPGSCPWSASAQAPWISITDGASGSGDGTVTFAIAANSAQDPRSTVITVAGHSIVVAQAPATPPAAPNGMRIIGE